jgi:hypothetical protein
MKTSPTLGASLFIALLSVGACGLPSTERQSADPAITCVAWTRMTDDQRISRADRMVADSADLLERIRVRQHQPAGTRRDTLILSVAQSVTKGCDVWATPDQSVDEVIQSLY